MSKEITAYVDRITEQNQAVIIAEEIGQEFIVDAGALKSGTWLTIIITEQNEVQSYTIDEKKTLEKQASISTLQNKLKSKQGSKFRKK